VEAQNELERLNLLSVPAVIAGGRGSPAWPPRVLADFLEIPYFENDMLSPATLVAMLDIILAAAQKAILQVPQLGLKMTSVHSNRSVRNLSYHIFRLSSALVDSIEEGHFPECWLLEEAPSQISSADQIAEYGESVRNRLLIFFKSAGRGTYQLPVSTYYGEQSRHELLERTAWHAAQHLRQLYALLEMLGVTPNEPLTKADLAGLPLPEAIW
jgi:hypothetical protein